MIKKPFVDFVEVEPISDSFIFQEYERQHFYYYYFEINQKYYLFIYGQTEDYNSLDFFPESITVIKQLNQRKRKIRSLRGYFLYVLEMLESSDDIIVLQTNLKPLFWAQLTDTLRQNQKNGLNEFLFGPSDRFESSNENSSIIKIVQNLQNEITLIKNKLETLQNHPPDMSAEVYKKPVNEFMKTSEHKLSPKTNEIKPSFKQLKNLDEEEQIRIIREGFQLTYQKEIDLKYYFEGDDDPNTLYRRKGYKLKYDNVRRSLLYKKLKEENSNNFSNSYP